MEEFPTALASTSDGAASEVSDSVAVSAAAAAQRIRDAASRKNFGESGEWRQELEFTGTDHECHQHAQQPQLYRLHFLRGSTQHLERKLMQSQRRATDAAVAATPKDLSRQVVAAGGGAHKFQALMQKKWNLELVPHKEFDSLVDGVRFLYHQRTHHLPRDELYTVEEHDMEDGGAAPASAGGWEHDRLSNERLRDEAEDVPEAGNLLTLFEDIRLSGAMRGVDIGGTLCKMVVALASHGQETTDNNDGQGAAEEDERLSVESRGDGSVEGWDSGNADGEQAQPALQKILVGGRRLVIKRPLSAVEGCRLSQGWPKPLYPFLLVSFGSGVSILKVNKDAESRSWERVGGTATGGATFLGLMYLLTSAKTFEEAVALAARGNEKRVDKLVGDIYGEDGSKDLGMPANMTAANFGKLVALGQRKMREHLDGKAVETGKETRGVDADARDKNNDQSGTSAASRSGAIGFSGFGYNQKAMSGRGGDVGNKAGPEEADVAAAVLQMITQASAVLVSTIASQKDHKECLKKVFVVGGFMDQNPLAQAAFARNLAKFDGRAIFLKHSGFLGALGSLRKDMHNHGVVETQSHNYAQGGLESDVGRRATEHARRPRSHSSPAVAFAGISPSDLGSTADASASQRRLSLIQFTTPTIRPKSPQRPSVQNFNRPLDHMLDPKLYALDVLGLGTPQGGELRVISCTPHQPRVVTRAGFQRRQRRHSADSGDAMIPEDELDTSSITTQVHAPHSSSPAAGHVPTPPLMCDANVWWQMGMLWAYSAAAVASTGDCCFQGSDPFCLGQGSDAMAELRSSNRLQGTREELQVLEEERSLITKRFLKLQVLEERFHFLDWRLAEALQCFRRCVHLDQRCALAFWAMAYVHSHAPLLTAAQGAAVRAARDYYEALDEAGEVEPLHQGPSSKQSKERHVRALKAAPAAVLSYESAHSEWLRAAELVRDSTPATLTTRKGTSSATTVSSDNGDIKQKLSTFPSSSVTTTTTTTTTTVEDITLTSSLPLDPFIPTNEKHLVEASAFRFGLKVLPALQSETQRLQRESFSAAMKVAVHASAKLTRSSGGSDGSAEDRDETFEGCDPDLLCVYVIAVMDLRCVIEQAQLRSDPSDLAVADLILAVDSARKRHPAHTGLLLVLHSLLSVDVARERKEFSTSSSTRSDAATMTLPSRSPAEFSLQSSSSLSRLSDIRKAIEAQATDSTQLLLLPRTCNGKKE